MPSRIGSDLRRARTRREIELPEVEAATRIRIRFLRAIENEEWDALPGGVYTRGFIRTYGAYLGLDGDRLAEDYRREVEEDDGQPAPAGEVAPGVPVAGVGGGRRGGPRNAALALLAVAIVATIAATALSGGGGGGGRGSPEPSAPEGAGRPPPGGQRVERTVAHGVSLALAAGAEVWVCVLDAKGRHLVDGQILEAGAREGPFRSGSFTVSFGNGEVSMQIDGKEAEIPATASPIGYSIDAAGSLTELGEAERPTCL